MKFNKILLIIVLIHANCYSASKSLTKPALSQVVVQAAADARGKHEVDVKTAAQAAGAGGGKTYAKVARGKEISVEVANKCENMPLADITKSDKCIIFCDYEKAAIEFLNNKKVVILRTNDEEIFSRIIELRDDKFVSIQRNDDLGNSLIRVWDFSKDKGKECVFFFECPIDCVFASIIQLKDNRLALWSKSNQDIYIVDMHNNKSTLILKRHKNDVYLVMQLDDGRLISSDKKGTLIVWDISKAKIESKIILKLKNLLEYDAPIIKLDQSKVAMGHGSTVYVIDLTKKNDGLIATKHTSSSNYLSGYWAIHNMRQMCS